MACPAAARSSAAAPAPSARAGSRLVVTVLVLITVIGVLVGVLGHRSVELGGDQRVVLGPQVDLVVEV